MIVAMKAELKTLKDSRLELDPSKNKRKIKKKKQNQKRNRILDQRSIFMREKTGAHFKLGELGLSLLTVAKMKADQK